MKRALMNTGLLAAALVLAAPSLASAQTQAQATAAAGMAGANQAVVRVDLTGGSGAQSLTLPRGKSAIIELPVDARDVLVTNPAVADAVLRSPRRIYVLGMASGQTDAVFFDALGRRILSLDIRVDQDTGALVQTIRSAIPGSQVQVQALNDSVILSGMVANAIDADRAVQIARQFVAKPEQVVNLLGVAGKDQVTVKVRIIEVQRNVIKQLGFDTSAILNNLSQTQFLFAQTPTYGVNGNLVGGAVIGAREQTADNTYRSVLQAFERVGLVRTLAEPNLTAVSGEAAKFLAGGEFPVPVAQDEQGRITIEFKPFGVGLGFTPVVLSGGRISLKISTEVSELTNIGAFSTSTGDSASLVIPALNVRRAETTVELPSGGSMMIAGLLQQTTKQTIDSLPGMTNLPVLGTLFRSRDFLNGETELVVLVTPYIVSATAPRQLQTPADGLRLASDPETVFLGRLNKAYGPQGAPPAGAPAYQGPVGYVIE